MNPSHISNQEIDGERTVIPGRFKLLGKTKYTFEVGYYQPEYTLVIDPTLDYSTYLGGELGDTITGVALDADGHSYLTGITDSLDFPTTAGAFDGSLPPGNGTFITKLDAEGSNLIYSTFLGGNGRDEPGGIAVDGLGSAYVIGSTFSTDFPTTPTRFQPNHGGSLWDAFVTKLSPDGSGLVYSSYLGGDGDEFGSDIAVDIAGSAYLVGETRSSDFPTVDAFQPEFGGGFNDVFIAKVDLAGSSLVYSSYLGGSSDDELFGTSTVAVGSDGSAYVAGVTESVDFPTAGPFQAESAGGRAGFVSKVSPEGSALDYSTYIGGSGTDIIEAITVDIDGNAYFTGRTQSADFPIANPWQADLSSGNEEAFVVKLNPAGSALIYSTYLGGEGSDVGRGIALDADGNVYVSGTTSSIDFPTENPFQPQMAGVRDLFLTKLNPTGSALSYSTYLGGSDSDEASALAVDAEGSAYVVGNTRSADFPTTPFALDGGFNGGAHDGFIAKISGTQDPSFVWVRQFGTPGSDFVFTVGTDGLGNAHVVGYTDGEFPGQTSSGSTDAFVRKYDANGNEVWTRQFGTSAQDLALAGTFNSSGEVYAAGSTSGEFPGQTSSGNTDAFLRKYDSNGTEVWTRQFGSSSSDSAADAVLDGLGNVYLAGSTDGALPGQASAGSFDAFVRKYDSNGFEVWTRQFGTASGDFASAVAVDGLGNTYVAGSTSGTFPGQTSSGSQDAFVRKYDANGNEVWTRQFGSSSFESVLATTVDGSGNIYLTGQTGGAFPGQTFFGGVVDAFVRKYDSDGIEVWTREFGTSSEDSAEALAISGSGDVLVAGRTEGALPGKTSVGNSDAFLRKFDGNGNEVWTLQFGTPTGNGAAPARGVAVDGSDNIYVAGDTGGLLLGTEPNLGGSDAYVVKIGVSAQGSFEMPLSRQSLGGGTSSSANFMLQGSAGGIPGQTQSAGFNLQSGFWPPVRQLRGVPTVLDSGSGTVTPVDGGTVSTGTGDASEAAVVVPAGAVDENTVLQVAAISATDPNLPPLPVNTLPLVFRFTPDGFVFNTTVTLNITYSDSQIVGFPESTLVPYLVVGDTVVQVAPCLDPDAPDPDPCFASLDTANNIMSINTTHFSSYGVEGVVATATADPGSGDSSARPDDDDDDDNDDDDDVGSPGGVGGGGAPPETPELDVTAAESSSEIFTPNTGGMVDTGSGDAVEASVEVPPGAVDQEVNIQIEAILTTDPALPTPPAGTLSRTFRFSPTGLQFLVPVVIRLNYDESAVAGIDESTFMPILLVDGEWVLVQYCSSLLPPIPDPCLASRDTVNNQLTISTTHFSIYGVQAVIPAAGVATAVEPLGDNLVRAWHFNNTTKEWAFYDPRPIFSESNTLEDLVPGDAYFVRVNSDQTAVLNDKVQVLHAGWNLIGW